MIFPSAADINHLWTRQDLQLLGYFPPPSIIILSVPTLSNHNAFPRPHCYCGRSSQACQIHLWTPGWFAKNLEYQDRDPERLRLVVGKGFGPSWTYSSNSRYVDCDLFTFTNNNLPMSTESCHESSALNFVTSLGIADLIGESQGTLLELSKRADVDPQFLGKQCKST